MARKHSFMSFGLFSSRIHARLFSGKTKNNCGSCGDPRRDCVCGYPSLSFRLKQVAFVAGFVMALLSIGCTSASERAAQFGTRDLALTGVAVSPLCTDNEESFQVHGQKYSVNVPVVQQQFQLGISQVVCCSKDACRLAGESNLFPRPEWVGGASAMIEGLSEGIRNHLPSSLPAPPRKWEGVSIPQ